MADSLGSITDGTEPILRTGTGAFLRLLLFELLLAEQREKRNGREQIASVS